MVFSVFCGKQGFPIRSLPHFSMRVEQRSEQAAAWKAKPDTESTGLLFPTAHWETPQIHPDYQAKDAEGRSAPGKGLP